MRITTYVYVTGWNMRKINKFSKTSKIVIAIAIIIAVTSVIVLLTMVTAKVYQKAPSIKRSEIVETDKSSIDIGDDKSTIIETAEIRLPILMYHNIIPSSYGTKYEVTVDDLKKDFQAIKDNGFNVVSAESVIAYANGARIAMPDKPIMLTFDDGFYNYNKFLMPMLNEFGYSATVGVVGDFTKFNKNTDSTPNYTYVDYDDMKALSECGITIANHSASMHYMAKGKKGVMPTYGENSANYRERFKTDTLKMHENLSKIGIKPNVYVYPYGLFNKISEEVLKELEYSMTLTCAETVNTVTAGNRDSIRLLGRFNRDGRKPIQPLLDKFK